MMSWGKHPGDWVTVTKSQTSWRMTQHSTFQSIFNPLWRLIHGKWPTLSTTLQLQSQYTSWQMHHSLHLTLSRCFISTKESSVFFQETSSPSRMSNYKQIPLSSSQPSELVCGESKTGKKSNLSLFYSISSPCVSLPLNWVLCTALLATWNG